MITDATFYYIAIPAIIYVGISKAGFLNGTSFVGVPLLALVISPIQAAGIMLPVMLMMDAVGVWKYRQHFAWWYLRPVLPAAIIGISIGWASAQWINEAMIRLAVGIVAVVFAIDYFARWRPESKPGTLMGAILGVVAGFTSFVSHAGGPPFSMYLLPQRLNKMRFAGTTVLFFALVNFIKIIPYAALGQFSPENLLTALVLLPLAPISMSIGMYFVKRVPSAPFYTITYICVMIAGAKLVWDGLSFFLLS